MIADISTDTSTLRITMSEQNKNPYFSRRTLLKSFGLAPFLLRPSPFLGSPFLFRPEVDPQSNLLDFSDIRLAPRYPSRPPLEDIFRFVVPGSDGYATEKYATEIESIFRQWGSSLKVSVKDVSSLTPFLDASIQASSLVPVKESPIRSGYGIEVVERRFAESLTSGRDQLVQSIQSWLRDYAKVRTAEFEIYSIKEIAANSLVVRVEVRYDLVADGHDQRCEERVGSWQIDWAQDQNQQWKARRWVATAETVCSSRGPVFMDVTSHCLGQTLPYEAQLLHGADYWRTVLDGAVGVDIYCNNGVAAGDFNNDGFDDLYVCQPAGLPNRLFRNHGDGTFEDVTETAGVGVLDNTACALFADFQNRGRQDLLVVCGTGPLMFLNQGDGTFSLKRNAFKFARSPQGTFTHAAIADYDNDGRLDIYFCLYMYYLGLDQYHYPIPYYDARNGPPNCLFHNEGDGTFIETTEQAGLNADNGRYSFSCSWGNSTSSGLPDLFVANDFGSSQLYRNNGNGTFAVVSNQAHVEGVGAGMSCCWSDFDNDGLQDIYVPSMWEAAGQRVSEQSQFHAKAPASIRELYQRHARGNALYRNQGDGTFQNVGHQAGVEMGRWSWSSDFLDFDHDGYSDLYVANGYLSGPNRNDLASFFWRQVVAKSSEDATGALAYEHGWNAINELVRSDYTWHGYARNVMFINNRDGTFSEVSGPAGLDFAEDCRSFALADFDHDGRLEIALKSRNAPQLRMLHNVMQEIGHSISFSLRGHKSNRDAIGAAITVESEGIRQTKFLQAGTGFLAQHSKELFFGVGKTARSIRATIKWPGGLTEQFDELPVNHRIQLEEGTDSFAATPFIVAPQMDVRQASPPPPDTLPTKVETWLIEPLKAPSFSLPDISGQTLELRSFLGGFVLLTLWAMIAPSSRDQLNRLHEHRPALASAGVKIVAMNVDRPDLTQHARSIALEDHLSFPVVFATEDIAGIYNITYRHLFDRRRDLPIPIAFLLDPQGMIATVYQGPIDPAIPPEDMKSFPADAEGRMKRALPFKGVLVQDAFRRNDFTYGVAMFQHGYLDQAAESFQQVITTDANNPDAYYNLGTLNLQRHNLPEARRCLEQTLKLRPNYPEAWNNLGMMAAQRGQPDEAIADFKKSLQYRPNYATAFLNLGNAYRHQGSFAMAEDALNRALGLQPDDPEVNYSLGMLYAQQNQTQRASELLQRAIDLRPNYPEALNNLGVLFVRTQDFSKAEAQFKAGIQVAPGFEQSYLNLARLYLLQNDGGKARDVLLQLLRLQPQNANARQALEAIQ
jgi:Flp pilus assembly protein TadD/peroxiredoxin